MNVLMKRKLLTISLAAAFLLSGCGESSESESSRQTSASSASQSSTTASKTVSSSEPQGSSAETTAGTDDSTQTTTTQAAVTNAAPKATTTTAAATTVRTTPVQTTTAAPRPVNSNDKTKPTVFDEGKDSYHIAGTAFDINNYVGYGDDTDRNPKLTYTGSVNIYKLGDYPLKATVTDASGNSVSWELTVHVVNKYPTAAPIKNMPFGSFVSTYKADNTCFGIDVSQWQGLIDYKAVKNAGCSFVFIRVGTKYSSYTLDPYFRTNLNNAIAAGLDVGVYIYTTDHTAESARQTARWIVSQLGGKKLTLPVAFDFEEIANFQKLGASINDMNNAYTAFKNELAKSGYTSMIYGELSTLNGLWNDSVKNSSPVWLACYRDKPEYSGNFGIWQVCCGNIAGINGAADFNVLYTDKKYK